MTTLEKLAFGIVTIELIVMSLGKREMRKRTREFMQQYYGVSTVDELIKKQEEISQNIIQGS